MELCLYLLNIKPIHKIPGGWVVGPGVVVVAGVEEPR